MEFANHDLPKSSVRRGLDILIAYRFRLRIHDFVDGEFPSTGHLIYDLGKANYEVVDRLIQCLLEEGDSATSSYGLIAKCRE